MSKTKKFNDPSVPRIDSIADDALVTVADKTTGTVSTIEFSKLKSQLKESMVQFISVKNLAKNSKLVTYKDNNSGHRTYPINIFFDEAITLSAGDKLSVAIESISDTEGGFARARFVFPSQITAEVFLTENSRYGVITAVADVNLDRLYLYCVNSSDSTGLVGAKLHGLTIVRGDIPMLGWMPTPSEISLISGG